MTYPINQFGEQTPGTDEEVHNFCTGRFAITFPQYSKIEVNGENAILRPIVKKWTRITKIMVI